MWKRSNNFKISFLSEVPSDYFKKSELLQAFVKTKHLTQEHEGKQVTI